MLLWISLLKITLKKLPNKWFLCGDQEYLQRRKMKTVTCLKDIKIGVCGLGYNH